MSDTRVLLRSLEELRDSLSARVNQLASAVERLRIQAGELERSITGQVDPAGHQVGRGRFSGELQIPERNSTSSDIPIDPPISTTSRSYTSTSAIASEVSQLDRPITSAEIHLLLDRASANLSATPDLRAAEMEGTLDGLREVRDSLQGGIAELAGMSETQAQLREAMRLRRVAIHRAVREAGAREGQNERGTQFGQAVTALDQESGTLQRVVRVRRVRENESMEMEAQRRLAEIASNRQDGSSRDRREKRLRLDQISQKERFDRPKRSEKPLRTGLRPTNVSSEINNPTVIRTNGVDPPPPRAQLITPAARSTLIRARSTAPALPSNADVDSIEAFEARISQLDPDLGPAEYISAMSEIVRQMRLDSGGTALANIPADHPLDSIIDILEETGHTASIARPSPWVRPDSPTTSNGSSENTAMAESGDAALTYRGRDVQDRLRVGGTATPDLTTMLGPHVGGAAVRGIRSQVASMLERSVPGGRRPSLDTADRPRVNPLGGSAVAVAVADRQNTSGTISNPSATTYMPLTTYPIPPPIRIRNIRQPIEIPRPVDILGNQPSERYEETAMAELRLANAQRRRVYDRYEDLLQSRRRREARVPDPGHGHGVGHARGVRSVGGSTEADLLYEITIDIAREQGMGVEGGLDIPDPEEAELMQELLRAQMREGRAQQRLIWAQSRMRREPEVTGTGSVNRDTSVQASSTRLQSGTGQGAAGSVPAGAEPSLTVGPRNERPEEVDTMVRIRQLQAERPRAAERIEARRRQLAAIRSDLAESRRRVSGLGIAAAALRSGSGADSGGGTTLTSSTTPADMPEEDRDVTIQRLLDDARQVSEARRNLMIAIEGDDEFAVTPSSPVTAMGHGDFSHIQISVGTDVNVDEGTEVERSESSVGEAGHGVNRDEGVVVRVEERPEAELDSDAEEEGADEKSSLTPLAQGPAAVGADDSTELGANDWHMPRIGRSRRRERAYVSLLDLQ